MRKKLLVGVLAFAALLSNNVDAKDSVLMTINGKDVTLSEFEYLYNKNKQSQIEKQTFEKYVDMFVTYKLKVADAEEAGIDKTASFINEFNGYRDDLAAPYLKDDAVTERLAKEAYDRKLEDVDVSHIMLYKNDPVTHSRSTQLHLADSLKQCILNGESFEDLAVKYSIDGQAKRNKGHMGFIREGLLPYSFEYAAYQTPVGGISDVVETDYGFHLIKVHGRRPSMGEVLVEHVMKLFPRGANEQQKLETKAKVDSLYNIIINGGDFEDIARRESEDPGSARNGGKLPWFGTGRMVPQFEAESFRMEIGEISKPIETMYGYHVIKKLDKRGVDSFENLKKEIIATFARDSRASQARDEKIAQIKKDLKYQVFEKGKKEIISILEKHEAYDSLFLDMVKNYEKPLITYADQKLTGKDLAGDLKKYDNMSVLAAKGYIDRTLDELGTKSVVKYKKNLLEKEVPAFANLVHEYRDGLLLYEISNQKVWDKANRDKEGLEKYFQEHKNKYTWKEPKYKGFIIQVVNDSVAKLVKDKLPTISNDTLISTMKKAHGHNIKIERVLVSKGENELVDVLVFAKNPEFKNPNATFPVYFEHSGRIIAEPEEARDVRGLVTVDYQNALEKEWVKELKNKYKVKINKKVLKKVK